MKKFLYLLINLDKKSFILPMNILYLCVKVLARTGLFFVLYIRNFILVDFVFNDVFDDFLIIHYGKNEYKIMGKIKEGIIAYFKSITVAKVIGVLLGNVIIGLGVAGLKLSFMGNDPYTAMVLALSDVTHIRIGHFQLLLNLTIFIVQLIWGRKYIGFGTLVNMCLLGYLLEFWSWVLNNTIGSAEGHGIVYGLIYMALSLICIALGLSMYQTAALGVAPYDYLALGMTEAFKPPYFVNRVITDAACVSVIVVIVLFKLLSLSDSHLGVGTVICAFCFGPVIHFFDRYSAKWIK